MSDQPQGPGWWQASDLRWYPPEAAPGAQPGYQQPAWNQGPPPAPKSNAGKVVLIVVGIGALLVALLGIAAAVIVFSVGSTTEKAQDKACAIELKTLRTAEEAAKFDTGGTGYVDLQALIALPYYDRASSAGIERRFEITLDGPSGQAQSFTIRGIGKCQGNDFG